MLNLINDTLTWLASKKDSFGSIQTVALIVGGLIALFLYQRRRKNIPRLKIEQTITHIGLSAKKTLVRVTVSLENKGEVKINLNKGGYTRLQQVKPLQDLENLNKIDAGEDPVKEGKTEISWPLITIPPGNLPDVSPGHRFHSDAKLAFDIEPGESEEFHCDFIIDNEVTVVQAYTFITNPKKDMGWAKTTIYELPSTDEKEKDKAILMPNKAQTTRPQPGGNTTISQPKDGEKKGQKPKDSPPISTSQPTKSPSKKP